jgi:hypothetical protein
MKDEARTFELPKTTMYRAVRLFRKRQRTWSLCDLFLEISRERCGNEDSESTTRETFICTSTSATERSFVEHLPDLEKSRNICIAGETFLKQRPTCAIFLRVSDIFAARPDMTGWVCDFRTHFQVHQAPEVHFWLEQGHQHLRVLI